MNVSAEFEKLIGPGIFPGNKLFDLKATYGFPLEFALDRLINIEGMAVSWADYIEAARQNGRWDFQSYEDICHAMEDAQVSKEIQEAIKVRFQAYVIKHPHPKMNG